MILSNKDYKDTDFQRLFRKRYNKPAPSCVATRFWVDCYRSSGDNSHKVGRSRVVVDPKPQMSRKAVPQVQENNPRVSLLHANQQTGVSKSTISAICGRICVFPYKWQIGSQLTDQNKHVRVYSAEYSLTKLADDAEYLKKVIYSDECVRQ